MNKSQWVEQAAKKYGFSVKEMKLAYRALAEVMEKTLLSGEEVQMSGFGTFEVRTLPAYTARNPKTNETVEVTPSRRISFLPGKTFKGKLNET